MDDLLISLPNHFRSSRYSWGPRRRIIIFKTKLGNRFPIAILYFYGLIWIFSPLRDVRFSGVIFCILSPKVNQLFNMKLLFEAAALYRLFSTLYQLISAKSFCEEFRFGVSFSIAPNLNCSAEVVFARNLRPAMFVKAT